MTMKNALSYFQFIQNTTEKDLEKHKRKIFIQNISPETTKQSLNDYFSKYPIEWCAVPLDETGKMATISN